MEYEEWSEAGERRVARPLGGAASSHASADNQIAEIEMTDLRREPKKTKKPVSPYIFFRVTQPCRSNFAPISTLMMR